jgi:hypothetical protein
MYENGRSFIIVTEETIWCLDFKGRIEFGESLSLPLFLKM